MIQETLRFNENTGELEISGTERVQPPVRPPKPRGRRPGGKPTYTPETAARRAAGRVTLGLTPEDAEALRERGEAHPGGMAGVVADWLKNKG